MSDSCHYLESLTRNQYCQEKQIGDTYFCATHQPKSILLHQDETTEICLIRYCKKRTTHSLPMPFCDQHFDFIDYWWRGTLSPEWSQKAAKALEGLHRSGNSAFSELIYLQDAIKVISEMTP